MEGEVFIASEPICAVKRCEQRILPVQRCQSRAVRRQSSRLRRYARRDACAPRMLLTSFPLALHCVVQPNNLNMLTEDDIKNALKAVKYPGYSRDIVSFGLVKQIAAKDGAVSVSMQLTTHNPEAASQIKIGERTGA